MLSLSCNKPKCSRAVQTPLHSAPAPLPPPGSPERTANLRRRPPRLSFPQDERAAAQLPEASDDPRLVDNAAWTSMAAGESQGAELNKEVRP